ncbi:hypothetical protein FJU08_01380 [Martelella alba]|uniref:Uncharacterized protein n=1 Tax=Martelella alba TaxID=2590451 RepID=A0A506UIT4_9HYPH|nr:hypothetical protein [Martelella alba]TPW33244.1 hypothetical protein FJU08_01380 [Martelella alba]
MPQVPDEYIPARPTLSAGPAMPDETPSLVQTIGAAGTIANWPYRGWRYVQNRAEGLYDPNYNPFDDIRGTKYESDPGRFAYARNADETQAIKQEWDQDEHARSVLARSGWTGTVATLGMGLVDPTIFVPILPIFRGAAAGASTLRIAADVGLTAGATAALGEAVMNATTPDYSAQEMAMNIGSATILGGLLGAGAGALINRSERSAIAAKLTADREAFGADVAGSAPQPQGAGAAASDTRQLDMRTVPGLDKLPDPTAKISPSRRVLTSPFVSARRATADLVETPYIFDENVAGIATTQGPALDRSVKIAVSKARVGMSRMFEDAYSRYRYGESVPNTIMRTKDKVSDLMRPPENGKLTFEAFKAEVSNAMINGDKSAIPEAQEAAQWLRSNVFDPWKERAAKAGLLPEDVGVATADSYFMRIWNKDRLIARRPEAVRIFSDWLAGEEAKKAKLQAQITDDAGLLETYSETVDKLQRDLATAQRKLQKAGVQAGEATSINSFAFRRSGQMRETLPDAGSRIKSIKSNARGGAVFESRVRNRGNVLGDRMSGLSAEIDDLTRRLNEAVTRRDNLRSRIEDTVSQWDGKSTAEAKAALKARASAEAERTAKIDAGEFKGTPKRMTSADSAVDLAVKRILSGERILDRQELDALANEIVDRIVGGPDGRLPYDAHKGSGGTVPGTNARGPLAARNFMIPDNLVRDFLEQDAHHVGDRYLNTMVPDVLLTERFGDADMTEVFKRLNEEAAALEKAAPDEKARRAIGRKKDSVEADIAAMRDRIRHTYGYTSDPRSRLIGRVAATAARYDVITNLGGAALSALSDMAGLQWRYGFTGAFRHAWLPFIKAMGSRETRAGVLKYREQLQTLGIAAETYLATRMRSAYDVLDIYRPTTRFERGMEFAADKFGIANGLTIWTDFGKWAAGMISSGETLRAAEALANGKASGRQIRDLAEGGIDAVMADRILQAAQAPGGMDEIGGIRLPNTGNWADRKAAEAFEGIVARDVDIMIITPGAEKPLMMSKPIAALVLQYKTFVTAANERLLVRSLQARDMQALQGVVSAIGLGILSDMAYRWITGREAPENTADWIKAGVTKSGILGWYQEGNAVLEKWTGGTADAFRLIGAGQPDTRYISRSPGAALMGPVYGKMETAVTRLSKLAAKGLGEDVEWTAGDTRQMRRLLPFQNLFYIRKLLDSLEGGFNQAIGVEPAK